MSDDYKEVDYFMRNTTEGIIHLSPGSDLEDERRGSSNFGDCFLMMQSGHRKQLIPRQLC